jgi:transposase-like protein
MSQRRGGNVVQKRIHSREFKLQVVHQVASGEKRQVDVCKEYKLAYKVLWRWRKEYQELGEAAFLSRETKQPLSQEILERKRAWDRDYYQRHRMERRAAVRERKMKFSEYFQQLKAKMKCLHCDENHPAVLQFHHRDPAQKEFNISDFVTHQSGGIRKLQKEIEKCDIVCANCHLKLHYENDHRRVRLPTGEIIEQLEQKQDLII